MADLKKLIKDMFVFKEPEPREEFILEEKESEKIVNVTDAHDETSEKKKKGSLRNLFSKSANSEKKDSESGKESNNTENMTCVSKNLKENVEYLKKRFSIPINGDVVLREFDIVIKDRKIPACLIFYDGMVNGMLINLNILQPLMLLSNLDVKGKNGEKDIAEYIHKSLVTHNQVKVSHEFDEIVGEINFGGCGVFIDGIDVAYACDVKGWQHRGVDRPNNEIVIRGPQESFNEILRVNTALVRKILKDEDLVAESIEIGKRSKTPCSLLYIKDIANESLVNEVRRRLQNIKTDYIFDTGELEQYIEDNTLMSTPQIVATERPDRVASMLAEGKVAVIMSGSPFALVMPTTNNDFLQSAEDAYVRFPYANLLRIMRVIAIFMSLLLPGLYVAITNYHHEMIPTDLLFAIEASRERVPFPSVVEIIIMEFAFELIREAGLRVPSPIGPTLGIIGALILGQAAVAANIVSPILIIVVAVTGIGSFAIPNFSLGFSFRILRFAYVFLAAMAGFLGITFGLFVQSIILCNAKSFGVPFMAPFGPKTKSRFQDQFFRSPIWKQEKRPDFLNTKDTQKQPKISRQWRKSEKKKGKQ
ncbi:MAG TPA: spore germination protein [Hungateiclostridium thermocellum]|uniref:GerA spore germination protein n=1 Tax=Acetivibrio thermocellus (strain ATCC 27405 / DSM 1237 / JCM 9322 / NBRC 103400 / NCIMB 10682 / NRRL B-4536 / VPI 7372) TaxID=203119 RepID=A3DD73_ACET2|nr:spore germination protein [Acetivibrio thermocellus]CDG35361.1 GerA spore germination protein [Acetivibrio thermocellus BC1]ABN51902.1 GerA spore germination protein [Acetivibrio thermocellus ATCC 27405]THJ78213.1 spore germination protein [Acetivibrio thermocellus]UWV45585.1 spore germination protein [Acetivibrio thermocellus]HBW27602.1 spore germination protein [Acetivibrio thermocellus]